MTQIEALAAALTEAGFKANIFKGQRIYLNGYGRDISAYITLDYPDDEVAQGRLFDGCALKVFSNCDSQTGKWRTNRAKQIKHAIMERLYSEGDGITAYLGAPCENWEDVIL
jgi:hypothetical protein